MPTPRPDQTRDRVFRAVADPVRRRILDQLQARALPVHAIAARFPISRPAVSRHLRILRSARLVRQRRSGREQVYEIDPTPLTAIDGWLDRHRAALRAALHRLQAHVEADSPQARGTHADRPERE
ncbi:MAG: ArsR/SmtB family transcription factor [Gemmatimonadales bacterium]